MRVVDVMRRDVVLVSADDTLAAAAKIMRENGISSVVVKEGAAPVGIVTERDYVRLVAEEGDPRSALVRDWMSTDLVTVTSQTDIGDAAQIMSDRGIRHLPVVDDGALVGMCSIRDPVGKHPALRRLDEDRRRDPQARIADAITAFAGSMPFVYVHVVWFTLWIALRVERFPFGLLTMIVSLEAIFLATFVMISQNRADTRRQVLADHQWELVQQEERQNEELLQLSSQILALSRAIHDLSVATSARSA
jgi:CBS domain-containing protein/low affinity Fe/Cu permease